MDAPIAQLDGADIFIAPLSDEVRDALAAAERSRLRELAKYWNEAAEAKVYNPSLEAVLPVVDELATPVRQAKQPDIGCTAALSAELQYRVKSCRSGG
ncbi:hypothetical protein [Amycolatopsis sp. FDAARGOS 1241]|uniref:hypothetical protein n=1 Tax=Amycolatopsis sp. FDAARGOS 1241 TaxID=2778070 RepID=UPI001950E9B5|nr:hypothetical protein [Amycolatopsis sp. FDAARGOS 1241]QRP48115.1 hypothetical protein I6J71_09650 [Amycolatopsis sp. FDAARGOS 1241]